MPLGQTVVNYGNIQSTFLLQVALAPTSLTTGTAAEQTFSVPGLLVGDQVSDLSFVGAWTVNVTIANCRVSANNTLAISFSNTTAGTLSPPTGQYLLEVNRPAQLPLPSIIQ